MKNSTKHYAIKATVKKKPLESQIRTTLEKKGGNASKYEERTKQELYEQAKKVGIEGRSKMDKNELIQALSNH